jgi:hypothetical protein
MKTILIMLLGLMLSVSVFSQKHENIYNPYRTEKRVIIGASIAGALYCVYSGYRIYNNKGKVSDAQFRTIIIGASTTVSFDMIYSVIKSKKKHNNF